MSQKSNQRQSREMAALFAIQQSIHKQLQIDEVAQSLVDQLHDILGCSACAVLLVDHHGKSKILAENGFSDSRDLELFAPGKAMIDHVMRTEESLYIGDLRGKSVYSKWFPNDWPSASLFCIPLMVNGNMEGIVYLDSQKVDAFSDEKRNFGHLMTEGMSLAMERSNLRSEVNGLRVRDQLTGCLNRRKFEADLESEVARAKRYQRPLSFLLIDVDWTEEAGWVRSGRRGDLPLKALAELLLKCIRDTDQLYRYGEREFIALLPETEKENAELAAGRLRQAVAQNVFGGESRDRPGQKVRIEIAPAGYPLDGNSTAELLQAARTALRQTKGDVQEEPAADRSEACVLDRGRNN